MAKDQTTCDCRPKSHPIFCQSHTQVLVWWTRVQFPDLQKNKNIYYKIKKQPLVLSSQTGKWARDEKTLNARLAVYWSSSTTFGTLGKPSPAFKKKNPTSSPMWFSSIVWRLSALSDTSLSLFFYLLFLIQFPLTILLSMLIELSPDCGFLSFGSLFFFLSFFFVLF